MIANRYRIDAEIGAGGMGTVYKGIDTQTGQAVAIKHLKPQLTSPDLIERFKREGEALRELNHPNIVKMLDTVEENGDYYLIIEYLSGGDLNDLLKSGKLPVEKVLQLAIDICDALTRAHRLNIIHRDLKPANVLIAADGTPRLSDFGIAHIKGKQRVTASDAIIGTVDYLAPEILDGAELDPRVDVWAFGVMLFEMLAGKRPFTGDSLAQTLMAIVTQPTPDLEALCPDAPIALIDLIYRMLEKDSHARIASVRHVGAELEDILQGRSNRPQQASDTNRFETPIPDSLHRPKHNLPAQTTPFVGREAELSELAKLLDNPKIRLITIVAQGGMGKTRLALELGEQALTPNPSPRGRGEQTDFANGVYIVELAPLSDPANIISAIADATGYQFQGDGRDQKQQVCDFLSNKNMLLVLDNFEHLLEGTPLVTDILKAAPNIKILATSRQRLNQSGETVFNLQGMDFPAWETPADALEYAAVKLFLQGAKRAKPDFEIRADNMDGIARICKLAQGMPLGILLSASWVAMLTPDEIAAEITRSIDFLESELSDMPERQRSMRAVFDYSWDLLTEAERAVFMKLSVFRGGFTREAAESVAGANLRILMSLINKSLIRRDSETGRYDIHELLRQYGEDRLETIPAEYDTTRDLHCIFFADFSAKRSDEIRGSRGLEAFEANDLDLDNILPAWEWALAHNKRKQIWQFMFNIEWQFLWRNRLSDLVPIWSQAIAAIEPTPSDTEKTELLIALYAHHGFNFDFIGLPDLSREPCEKSLLLLNQLEKPPVQREALHAISLLSLSMRGDVPEKLRVLDICIEGSKTHDYSFELGNTYLQRVLILSNQSFDETVAQINDSLNILGEIAQKIKNPFLLRFHKFHSGVIALREKNHLKAKRLLEEVAYEFPEVALKVDIRGSLAEALIELEEYKQAEYYYKEALRYSSEVYSRPVMGLALFYILNGFVKMKKLQRAVELAATLQQHNENPWLQKAGQLKLELLERQISPDEFKVAWEQGKTLDIETVVKELLTEFGENQA